MTFKFSNIKYLAGSKNISSIISEPFSDLSLDFFNELSTKIFKDKNSHNFRDLVTFAFWCRKNNLEKIKNNFVENNFRIGLGKIFHLTPSNVPIAFIYSFVFGMLSGNSNIIRVSNPNLEQVQLLINLIKKIFKIKKFKKILTSNSFIHYEKNTKISEYFSSFVDGRIIWGSNKTVDEFKKYKTKTKCVDLLFSDKYSLSFISSKKLQKLNKDQFLDLIKKFYNDVFIMDQNACSSPHLIVWEKKPLKNMIEAFWNELDKFVQTNYLKSLSISSKKYLTLNRYLLDNEELKIDKFKSAYINRIKLRKLEKNIKNFRGFSGIFFEYEIKKISDLNKILDRDFQTLSYFGYDKIFFKKIFKTQKFKGVDRIVPIGGSLDINLIWDGINVINHLSRIVNIK
ncbi:acyl-CoA reductase [Candidatus Pelagibacter sp.]|uniref:acyl-CoA reductase n=1 Tax=Candidatus Pelagibacter sp. TaxID=2024849 RepID=UPI003F825206